MNEDLPLNSNENATKKTTKNINLKNNLNQNKEENSKMVTVDAVKDKVVDEILTGTMKVSSKGQIVIPKEIRRAAGIKDGEHELRYNFIDGKIIIEVPHYLSADELFGLFNQKEDDGHFVLDIQQAREERGDNILNKKSEN